MKIILNYGFLAAVLLAVAFNLQAEDRGITAGQADRILEELGQIRMLLMSQAQHSLSLQSKKSVVQLKAMDSPMLGSVDAPITIVEFSDYQCSFCRRFYMQNFNKLKRDYINSGKVRLFVRDLPLPTHHDGIRAAQAGRCASEQGQYWTMRDQMVVNGSSGLAMSNLMSYAQILKMDTESFRSCLESEKYKEAFQKNVLDAAIIGVRGTPAFVVGRSTSDGVDGELVIGAQSYEEIEKILEDLALSFLGK
jgi:protein-disulfide isomerase